MLPYHNLASRSVDEIVADARQILEAQRRALSTADIRSLLDATSGLYGLAGELEIATVSEAPATERDVESLRVEVARLGAIIDRLSAATQVATRDYGLRSVSPSRSSGLLNQNV